MKSLYCIAIAVAIGLCACSAPLPKNDFIWASSMERLQVSHPVDIAIATPKDLTKRSSIFPGIDPPSLPLEEIRKITYRELINRRYSPLSLDFLDRSFLGKATLTEASWMEYRDRCGAEAVLRTNITRWDDSHLNSSRMISIGAEIFLEDAKTGEIIWQAKSDQDLLLSDEIDAERVSTEELRERGIKRFFRRLVSQLPIREIPQNQD